MSLTEKVRKITKVGKNGAVVEFCNGFGIAYEKRSRTVENVVIDDNGFVDGTNRVEANTLSYLVLGPSIDCGIDMSFGSQREGKFSESFERYLQKPVTSAQKKHAELEKTIESCYDSIVKPLQIEKFARRQWKEIALNVAAFAGLTAIWPIAAPTAMISYYFMNPSQAANALGTAIILAPLALPQVIYHSIAELINPTKTAYRVQNKKALSKTKSYDAAALIFKYDDRGTPKQFDTYSIVLPDGLSLYDGKKQARQANTIYCSEGRQVYAHKEKFNDFKSAKWFFKIDQDVKAQLYGTINERDALIERFYEFERSISKEEHYALIKVTGGLK